MQLVETTINRLMQAPHHSLHPTTNKCHHRGNVNHRSIKCYPKRQNRNERHLQNQEQEDSFQYTQVTTSAHNKQQPTTSTQATKWKWYRKISLPGIKTRHNDSRNSNDIYEIKNKTVFTTHNRQQQTTTNKHNVALPRTNTRHHNDNHFYDFNQKYIVSIMLLLYIVASMKIWLFDWFSTRNID